MKPIPILFRITLNLLNKGTLKYLFRAKIWKESDFLKVMRIKDAHGFGGCPGVGKRQAPSRISGTMISWFGEMCVLLATGFGVGLSWGVVGFHLSKSALIPIFEDDEEYFAEGVTKYCK
jgi:hypothetical protein